MHPPAALVCGCFYSPPFPRAGTSRHTGQGHALVVVRGGGGWVRGWVGVGGWLGGGWQQQRQSGGAGAGAWIMDTEPQRPEPVSITPSTVTGLSEKPYGQAAGAGRSYSRQPISNPSLRRSPTVGVVSTWVLVITWIPSAPMDNCGHRATLQFAKVYKGHQTCGVSSTSQGLYWHCSLCLQHLSKVP